MPPTANSQQLTAHRLSAPNLRVAQPKASPLSHEIHSPPQESPQPLQNILARILGPENVSADSGTLDAYSRTTSQEGTRPALVVRPQSKGEVRRVIKEAARHKVPVYPISRGKNWGYGDACAQEHGCILIDLSRMNRILEVNKELAYVVLEPGVTQGQLADYLEEKEIPLWMDATGAGPDASIVGNILERGIGLSPYSDRCANSCNYEVVLPDGQVLNTGFGSYPGAKARHLHKSGPGPSIDGLFTQANFGIVTRMTVWLLPKPKRHVTFFIRLRKQEDIGPAVERLRELRLSGSLRCSVHCFNDMRLLGGFTRYPYESFDGKQALEVEQPEWVARKLKDFGISSWVVTGSVAGSKGKVRASCAELKQAVKTIAGAKLNLVEARHIALAGRLKKLLPSGRLFDLIKLRIEKVSLWSNFLQGRASRQTLVGSHWRGRKEPGETQDPLNSGSGMIWVAPILPMTAQAVEEVSVLSKRILHRHGFEYQVTFSHSSERSLCSVISIQFDRASQGETQRARRCHHELVETLLDRGYVPYRGAKETIEMVRKRAPILWRTMTALKGAIDPDELVAPGRYIARI